MRASQGYRAELRADVNTRLLIILQAQMCPLEAIAHYLSQKRTVYIVMARRNEDKCPRRQRQCTSNRFEFEFWLRRFFRFSTTNSFLLWTLSRRAAVRSCCQPPFHSCSEYFEMTIVHHRIASLHKAKYGERRR